MSWVHASADVDPAARLGEGSRVWHLSPVREGAVIGRNCVLGRGAHVGPGVRSALRVPTMPSALVAATSSGTG
jgi:UDP-3-O-[3-hydroxymyristoyl] glucosamine N-acyltransferase